MSKQALFDNAEHVINWLDSDTGKQFRAWLVDRAEAKQKILRTANEEHELYRAQGAANEVIEILNLRNELVEVKKRKDGKNG